MEPVFKDWRRWLFSCAQTTTQNYNAYEETRKYDPIKETK